MTISLAAKVHPAIIGCLLLKWHSGIGNIIQLNTILRWSREYSVRRDANMVNDVSVIWQRLHDDECIVTTGHTHHWSDTSYHLQCLGPDQWFLSSVQKPCLIIPLQNKEGSPWDVVCLQGLSIYEAIWRQFFPKWSHLYLQLRLL